MISCPSRLKKRFCPYLRRLMHPWRRRHVVVRTFSLASRIKRWRTNRFCLFRVQSLYLFRIKFFKRRSIFFCLIFCRNVIFRTLAPHSELNFARNCSRRRATTCAQSRRATSCAQWIKAASGTKSKKIAFECFRRDSLHCDSSCLLQSQLVLLCSAASKRPLRLQRAAIGSSRVDFKITY